MRSERETWVERLLAPVTGADLSHLEWPDAVPSSKSIKGLGEQIEKIGFLKDLGADRIVLPDLRLAGIEHFARRLISRKPSALARIKDPHRTIEVACFLRLTLLRLTDASLTLLDHQIASRWRGARARGSPRRQPGCAASVPCSAPSRTLPMTRRSTPPICARACAA
ncbi:hypothetical protein P3T23_005528 [Paraburkholderia sp. GAS448]